MITYQDVIIAVRQMPNEERLTLMEELVHLLTAEWQPPRTGESSLGRVRVMLKPAVLVPSRRGIARHLYRLPDREVQLIRVLRFRVLRKIIKNRFVSFTFLSSTSLTVSRRAFAHRQHPLLLFRTEQAWTDQIQSSPRLVS